MEFLLYRIALEVAAVLAPLAVVRLLAWLREHYFPTPDPTTG